MDSKQKYWEFCENCLGVGCSECDWTGRSLSEEEKPEYYIEGETIKLNIYDYVDNLITMSVICRCDIKTLMNVGCTCGAMKAEREGISTSTPIKRKGCKVIQSCSCEGWGCSRCGWTGELETECDSDCEKNKCKQCNNDCGGK